MFVALCDEYTFRYGKVHMTDSKLREILNEIPRNMELGEWREPPQKLCLTMSKQNQVLKGNIINTIKFTRVDLQYGRIDPFLLSWNNMPNYDFLNKETGEIKEYFMSYKDLDEFKKNNPHLLQQVSAPNIVGGHGDRVKVDGGFKDVLNKIGDAHPKLEVHARHGSKDIKREKSVQTIKKHMDIQSKKK